MNALIQKQIDAVPMLSPGERVAIISTLEAGKAYGYGNLMAWLATAWAVELRDFEGFSEAAAIATVSGRGPYQLPRKPKGGA